MSVSILFWFVLLSVFPVVQPALDVADAAGPGAGADPAPGAATTTAAPGLTPSQGLSPSPGPQDEARQNLPQSPGPLGQGVEPRLQTESPNRGPAPNPRVGQNPRRTTEQRFNPDLDTA